MMTPNPRTSMVSISPPPPPPPLLAGVLVAVTVADTVVVPPGPVHAKVNVVVALSALVWKVPLTCCVPLQPPVAAQVVAF
jgi:hypothetical protein